jgi:hypothetical protein
MRLNVKAFGLACGILWGLGLFLLAWWFVIRGISPESKTFIERAYIGYRLTAGGSLMGLVWGFVDGLVGGVVFAWLYNKLLGSKG